MGHKPEQIKAERRVLIIDLYDLVVRDDSEVTIGFTDRCIHSPSVRRKNSDLTNQTPRPERNTDISQPDRSAEQQIHLCRKLAFPEENIAFLHHFSSHKR